MSRPLTRDEWRKALGETWRDVIKATYAEEIEAAVLSEREACARVCDAEDGDTLHDQTDCTWSKAARHCAAAIRARGEGK